MARIRSVHPGLFTDEAFMALSAHAQITLIGLWTEADDNGVFEWKPLTLKARLLPAAAVDMADLLAEIEAQRCIVPFEEGGRQYGAIRNFCRYQRPRSPRLLYPLPDEIRPFVGLKIERDGPDNTPDESVTCHDEGPLNFPRDLTAAERKRRERARKRDAGSKRHGSSVTGAEMSRQMEDGGGRREEGVGETKNKQTPISVPDAAREPPAAENEVYAWQGKLIRLNRADYDRWRRAYSHIPDFDAELQAADDWHGHKNREALAAGKPVEWFHAVSGWLRNSNARAKADADRAEKPVQRWAI